MFPKTLRKPFGWDSPLDFFSNDMGQALSRFMREGQPMDHVGVYPVDIREDANHLYVEAEMPGFTREQINITLENDVLHIQAQRESGAQPENQQKDDEHVTRHLNERRYTRISRAFSLPNTVDENKVEAKLVDGVLHLTLHKREEVKPRKIEVK